MRQARKKGRETRGDHEQDEESYSPGLGVQGFAGLLQAAIALVEVLGQALHVHLQRTSDPFARGVEGGRRGEGGGGGRRAGGGWWAPFALMCSFKVSLNKQGERASGFKKRQTHKHTKLGWGAGKGGGGVLVGVSANWVGLFSASIMQYLQLAFKKCKWA